MNEGVKMRMGYHEIYRIYRIYQHADVNGMTERQSILHLGYDGDRSSSSSNPVS